MVVATKFISREFKHDPFYDCFGLVRVSSIFILVVINIKLKLKSKNS